LDILLQKKIDTLPLYIRQKFDFLDTSYAIPHEGKLDVREIFSSLDPSIAFMGFVRPGVGAIPPLAEMQAMLWVGIISGKVEMPRSPRRKLQNGKFANENLHPDGACKGAQGLDEPEKEDYQLLQDKSARIQYGVDHGAYVRFLSSLSSFSRIN
jgi:hypothetical protein